MHKIKLIFYFLFICFLSLLFTGCSSYSELNNVMIVDAIGIDKLNDTYQVSFNTYLENDKYEVHTISDKNLTNIFNDLYLEANKKIYLSHLNTLFLSSNLDNDDIINIVNTFNKRNDLRGSFNVVLLHDYNTKIFSTPSEKIIDLLESNENELGSITSPTFNDIINDYLEFNLSYIPIIDSNLKIMGMHSILAEYNYYDNHISTYINLLMGKIDNLVLTIDDEGVQIKGINTCYQVDKNNLNINIDMSYQSNLDKDKISNYINDNINNLLNLGINENFFLNQIKKQDYYFYKDNSNINIKYKINLSLKEDSINNMKDGDLIEKD